MRYTRNLISLVIITMFVGLGSLFLITDQANAGLNCDIGITKVADPADDTPFNFSVTGSQNFDFTLMDPSNDTQNNVLTSSLLVNVTEDVPEGWSLDDIVCDEPIGVNILDIPNGKSFECLTSSVSANCTFFNSKDCSIEIVKVADPAEDTPFEFEILPSGQNFTLMDPSQQSFTFFLNGNETVRVTELPTEGFLLTDINCTTEDEENALILLDQRAVRITCELPGSSFACTFVNSTTKIPTLSEWGLIAMAGILGIVGFIMVMRRRKVTA